MAWRSAPREPSRSQTQHRLGAWAYARYDREKGWLGREDSNLRMAVPKTAALPLGDAPIGPPGHALTRTGQIRGKARKNGPESVGHPVEVAHHSASLRATQRGKKTLCTRPCPPAVKGLYLRLFTCRSVAQPGRALSSGGRGRWFESTRSDHVFTGLGRSPSCPPYHPMPLDAPCKALCLRIGADWELAHDPANHFHPRR